MFLKKIEQIFLQKNISVYLYLLLQSYSNDTTFKLQNNFKPDYPGIEVYTKIPM